jgi:hypothetical protein
MSVGMTSLPQITRKRVRATLVEEREYQRDERGRFGAGGDRPAPGGGKFKAGVPWSRGVPVKQQPSYEPGPRLAPLRYRVRASLAEESATVIHVGTHLPRVPSSLVNDTKADYTNEVPDEAFADDVQRKIKIRRSMGLASEANDAPSPGMKFTKEQVNYRYPATNDEQCQSCVYFKEPGSCKIVDGLIRRVDVCDKFRAPEGNAVRASLIPTAESRKPKFIVESEVVEVSPPGWSGSVKAMKKHPEISNPYALGWYMKDKGDKPHYKAEAEIVPKTIAPKMITSEAVYP